MRIASERDGWVRGIVRDLDTWLLQPHLSGTVELVYVSLKSGIGKKYRLVCHKNNNVVI